MSDLLKFRQRNLVPPGHKYSYIDPDTKLLIEAPSWPTLVVEVEKHRTANGLPITADMEELIEDNACRRLVERGFLNQCVNREHEWIPYVPKLKLRVRDVIRGTLTIGNFILKGRPLVSQDEAESRAAVCADCSFNVPHDDCQPCDSAKVEEAMKRLIKNKKTASDSRLRACYWCGCFNKAQVWFPLDVIEPFLSDGTRAQLPDHCWKKQRPSLTNQGAGA